MSFQNDAGDFTPISHTLAKEVGLVCAAVYGAVWRKCQMPEGICRASLKTLGADLSINRATVMRSIEKLCELGYLIDQTPDRRNAPHTYVLGKSVAECNSSEDKTVVIRNTQEIPVIETVAYNNSSTESVAQNNATVAERNATVAESYLNRVLEETPLRESNPKGLAAEPQAGNGPKTQIKDRFLELTHLEMPNLKRDKGFWWSQFNEILHLARGDPDQACRWQGEVVGYMQSSGLTITGPQSILGMVRALASGQPLHKNGVTNGHQRNQEQHQGGQKPQLDGVSTQISAAFKARARGSG